ncbi:hypothetical protein ACWC10_28590 [Streptomyces sp. NPDC001595]|uniref:hypothetical protein n=1 Tax=Streptomyces sp. NPDC001532 TaxID=3154520 RepID=UPI00331C4AE2
MSARPHADDAEPGLRLRVLFPDTQVDVVCPPVLARLLTGRRTPQSAGRGARRRGRGKEAV